MIPQTLSILIPVYNEAGTIRRVLEKLEQVQLSGDLRKEIIVVDDGSTDETEEVVRSFKSERPEMQLHFLKHNTNSGKGAAVQTGVHQATGSYLVIQDADLEYDPTEHNLLLDPIIKGFADVVYGSRFVGSKPHRVLLFWHYLGNRVLTSLSNVMTNLNLTDMECGLKLFRMDLLRSLKLNEQGFGFEAEVTAKISRIPNVRIYEVGVSYYGRTYAEGKKIRWTDGITSLWVILRYNLFG